jgi:hypothetical protein
MRAATTRAAPGGNQFLARAGVALFREDGCEGIVPDTSIVLVEAVAATVSRPQRWAPAAQSHMVPSRHGAFRRGVNETRTRRKLQHRRALRVLRNQSAEASGRRTFSRRARRSRESPMFQSPMRHQHLVLEVHASPRHGRGRRLLVRQLGHHGLGGDEQPGDRRRTLQRSAHHLGRIDDAL